MIVCFVPLSRTWLIAAAMRNSVILERSLFRYPSFKVVVWWFTAVGGERG